MTTPINDGGPMRQRVRRIARSWLTRYGKKTTPETEWKLAQKLAWEILDAVEQRNK